MKIGTSLQGKGLVIHILWVTLALSGCMRSPEAKSAAYLESGKKLLQKNEAKRAVLEFRNAAQATPRNPEVYYQLGLAFSGTGEFGKALASFRKAVELDPKHVAAQLRIAQLMSATDDPGLLADAKNRLKALMNSVTATPEMLNTLALTDLKLGQNGDAAESLQQALAESPQELSSSIMLAMTKLLQHDTKGAEEVLKKSCENDTKSAAAHANFGRFYAAMKRPAESEAQFKLALQIDPKSAPTLMALARLQLGDGRKVEAEQIFKRLGGIDKNYDSAYGIFLFQEGRREESIREFERVVHENPDDRQARTRLIVAYQASNRPGDAEKVLTAALEKNPKDLDALIQRGEFLLATGRYEEAENALNQVLRLKPDAPEAHYIMAKLYQARGSGLQRRQELAKAVQLNPNWLLARLDLVNALLSNKSARSALNTLNETPAAQRDRLPILVERNWVFWALGDMTAMRKGIDAGLSRARSEDLLVQDGLWKLRAAKTAEGRAILEEALKLNPADLRAMGPLVSTYIANKQLPVAIQKVKEYASQQKSAAVQQVLGNLLLAHGDRDGARAAFTAAKADDPKFAEADFSLAQVDVAEKKWNDARSRLNTMLSTREAPLAHLWLGKIEEIIGNHGAALEHFRKAVEADAANVEALNGLAYLLADYANKPDEALKYAEKAVELAPDRAGVSDTLGWVLFHKGLYPSAVQHLIRGAAQRDCAVCEYHLAMAYAKAGDSERGRLMLKVALHLNPNLPEAKTASDLLEVR